MSGQSILVIQKTQAKNTKTWTEHETQLSAVQWLIGNFATRMAHRNPSKEIGVKDIQNFVDRLYDIVIMVYDEALSAYVAHDAEWLKDRIAIVWTQSPAIKT